MLKLKYDVGEDRMELVLAENDTNRQTFWLCRRHCIGLLFRLSQIADDLKIELDQIEKLAPPQFRKQVASIPDQLLAQKIEGLSIKKVSSGAELRIRGAQGGVAVKLSPDGVKKMNELVYSQAERAGWDPAAGIDRLKALAAVRTALHRKKP
jgi:hypothetical protein